MWFGTWWHDIAAIPFSSMYNWRVLFRCNLHCGHETTSIVRYHQNTRMNDLLLRLSFGRWGFEIKQVHWILSQVRTVDSHEQRQDLHSKWKKTSRVFIYSCFHTTFYVIMGNVWVCMWYWRTCRRRQSTLVHNVQLKLSFRWWSLSNNTHHLVTVLKGCIMLSTRI